METAEIKKSGGSMKSVFTLDLKRELGLGVLSICLVASTFFINSTPGVIPDFLNISDVNFFDRGLIFPYNQTLDDLKYVMLAGALTMPIITPLAVGFKDTWLTYGVMYTQAILFTFGTRGLTKNLVYRYRPFMYYDITLAETIRDSHRSFPSGTVAAAFIPAAFLSVTFCKEFPDSPWRIPVVAGSFALATSVGVTRILAGEHFLTDVLVGAAIGSFYGWLIPTLHKRNNSGKRVSFIPTGNGGIVSLRF